jgi:hypothetical protein
MLEASIHNANWQNCQSMLTAHCPEPTLSAESARRDISLIGTDENDSYGNGFSMVSIVRAGLLAERLLAPDMTRMLLQGSSETSQCNCITGLDC